MNILLPKHYNFKKIFIEHSNAIDPQPGYDGNVPGCQMFENHMEALEFILNDEWKLTKFTPLDIHRFLTKGIKFFEEKGMSGKYRSCDVFINNQMCPSSHIIPDLIDTWFFTTKEMMLQNKLQPIEIAWISHHMFEVIHPFIDGNGRTGRLLLNKILTQLGHEPIIVTFEDRFLYYSSIQGFRKKYFENGKFHNLEDFI